MTHFNEYSKLLLQFCVSCICSYSSNFFISLQSKELVHTFKMNGSVDAIAFNNDGSRLFSTGDDGEVYVWDMDRRQCVHRFVDEGCINGTAIAVSKNSQYIACG